MHHWPCVNNYWVWRVWVTQTNPVLSCDVFTDVVLSFRPVTLFHYPTQIPLFWCRGVWSFESVSHFRNICHPPALQSVIMVLLYFLNMYVCGLHLLTTLRQRQILKARVTLRILVKEFRFPPAVLKKREIDFRASVSWNSGRLALWYLHGHPRNTPISQWQPQRKGQIVSLYLRCLSL